MRTILPNSSTILKWDLEAAADEDVVVPARKWERQSTQNKVLSGHCATATSPVLSLYQTPVPPLLRSQLTLPRQWFLSHFLTSVYHCGVRFIFDDIVLFVHYCSFLVNRKANFYALIDKVESFLLNWIELVSFIIKVFFLGRQVLGRSATWVPLVPPC